MKRLAFWKKFCLNLIILVIFINIVTRMTWTRRTLKSNSRKPRVQQLKLTLTTETRNFLEKIGNGESRTKSQKEFIRTNRKEFLEKVRIENQDTELKELLGKVRKETGRKESPENVGKGRKSSKRAPKKAQQEEFEVKFQPKQHHKKSKFNYKTILLWSDRFQKMDWSMPGLQRTWLKECPENRCRLVFRNDSHDEIITKYDSVLFHYPDFESFRPFPSRRSRDQIYAFVSEGAPQSYFREHFIKLKDFFNYTISYRLDSDATWPYAIIRDKLTNQVIAPSPSANWRPAEYDFHDDKLLKLAEGKTSDLMSVMSNCNARSNRNMLLDNLRKFIGVDVYGKCGSLSCDLTNVTCLSNIDQKYRFYASFENTLCKDYVTEKVYKVLDRNVIPLIYGGANYKNFLPPKSYINIADYSSIEELSKYLKFLSNNPKEYIKYLWWKKYYKVELFNEKFCQLCRFLHEEKRKEKIYRSIERWWMDDGVCDYFPVIKK